MMRRSPHAGHLDTLVSPAIAEGIARQTVGYPGPPIPVLGTGCAIRGDGDYVGRTYRDLASDLVDLYASRARRWARRQASQANAGFASLSDLISEATTGGKAQVLPYHKTVVTAPPAAAASQFMWAAGANPTAGANAAAGPGGTVPDNTSTGSLKQSNAGASDSLHLTTWTGTATVAGALMLVDYLFGVNISLNASNVAVTGVPTRYLSAAGAAGCIITGRVTTVMSATATNLTVTYKDQNNNTAEAAAAIAARVSSAVQTIPLTQPVWFIPLNAGDTGVRAITNVASSGANTGAADFVILKPLAILPVPVANIPLVLDGINSAFNLVQIQDGACLSFLHYFAISTTAPTHSGLIQLVSG